jgi:hypothetical protein
MQLQEEMFALISEWKNSGLTKKTFLVDRQIKRPKFDYWCNKYHDHFDGSEFPAAKHFQELVLRDTTSETTSKVFELTTPSGLHITVFG